MIEQTIYGFMPDNPISQKEQKMFWESVVEKDMLIIFNENYDHEEDVELLYEKVGTYAAKGAPKGKGTSSNLCSHLAIWERIVTTGKITAVLEHDARVLVDYTHIPVMERTITLLGPRVRRWKRCSYDKKRPLELIPVKHHGGSHAYAITPRTAEMLLEHYYYQGVHDSIDQWVFMRMKSDHIGLYLPEIHLVAINPPVVVAEYGDDRGARKESSIGRSVDNHQPVYNLYKLPGFDYGEEI